MEAEATPAPVAVIPSEGETTDASEEAAAVRPRRSRSHKKRRRRVWRWVLLRGEVEAPFPVSPKTLEIAF